jgi:uncharacterized protein (TIGR02996 family)
MSEDALIRAILASPEDATPRLVYADWLEERGDPRGEYLRLLCALDGCSEADPQAAKMRRRLRILEGSIDQRWRALFSVDKLIARIKARVADPLRAVDAATWVAPMPRIAPPATVAEVGVAEEALEFTIPPLLRRLYLEVGNGGFGPNYGLTGVPTLPPTPYTADIVVLYQQYSEFDPRYPAHKWPQGLVPLISGGCLYMECAYFTEPPHRVVLFDGNSAKWDQPVAESLSPIAPSLEARLEAWLDGVKVHYP